MTDEDPRLRLAFEQGTGAISRQREDLERLRSRAITLISVASVASGILLGIAGKGAGPRSPWLYVAFGTFGLLIACVCVILVPRKMIFDNDAKMLATDYVDAGYTMNDTLRWMTIYGRENYQQNEEKMAWLGIVYMLALIALGATLAVLSLAVLTRR